MAGGKWVCPPQTVSFPCCHLKGHGRRFQRRDETPRGYCCKLGADLSSEPAFLSRSLNRAQQTRAEAPPARDTVPGAWPRARVGPAPSPGSACRATRAREEAAWLNGHDNAAADRAVDPQAVASAPDGEGWVEQWQRGRKASGFLGPILVLYQPALSGTKPKIIFWQCGDYL